MPDQEIKTWNLSGSFQIESLHVWFV